MSGVALLVWGIQVAVCLALAGLGLVVVRRARRLPIAEALPPTALVVAVHGWGREQRVCLESLLAQRYPGRLEVVFALQDPGDPAREGIRELGWEDRVRVTARALPAGWTGIAWNYAHGIAESRSEVVVLACDDTLAEPDAVAALVTRLVRGAVIASAIPVVTGPRSPAAWASAVFYNVLAVFGWAPGVSVGLAAAWGGLMAFRRADLESAGGPEVMRGRMNEDLALARALTDGGRGAATLGPLIRSPAGVETWGPVWHRFLRIAAIGVYQSPYAPWITLPALLLQYVYLVLPLIAWMGGWTPVWILCGLMAATRWGFVAAASIPAGLGPAALALAPVADALHVAALLRVLARPGFSWAGIEYRVRDRGLERD